MRALVVTAHGGRDVLEVQQLPVPEPGPNELLVQVAASGVNFKDVYLREAIYPGTPPFVLGDECAGHVVAMGHDVTDFSVGDEVATASGTGTHAEFALVPAAEAVAVPAGTALQTAAAVMLQGMTAHYLVNSTYPVSEGDHALVHAAAGGVGNLLVQLVHGRLGSVVATVGSAEKERIAADAGADVVLRYDQVDDLAAAVREVCEGGVHVAYDGVGQATFDASLGALRRRGSMVLYGASSGPVPPVDPQRLNRAGSLFLTRPTLKDYVATREELLWRAGEILDAVRDGSLHVNVGGRYPLESAADAYRDLEGRKTIGKLLIVP
jgi:NADPH2:quinone reductase